MHLHTLQPSSADYLKNYKSNQESFYSIAVNIPETTCRKAAQSGLGQTASARRGMCEGWLFFFF